MTTTTQEKECLYWVSEEDSDGVGGHGTICSFHEQVSNRRHLWVRIEEEGYILICENCLIKMVTSTHRTKYEERKKKE